MKSQFFRTLAVACSILVAGLGAIAQTTAPAAETANASTPVDVKLRIGPGDLISAKVYGIADLTEDVRVSSDGSISFPLIGKVQVGGLTAEEAQAAIEERLAGGYVKNPHVTLTIKEYATQGASVLGEVTKPGVYPVLGTRHLLDMIAAAGGFAERAGKIISITHRDTPQEPVNVTWSRDPLKQGAENPQILPGDTIVVSRAGVVYVVGHVNKPSGFLLDKNDSMSVLQAIAMAEGTKPDAKLDNAMLIRKTATGERQELPIPLKKILNSQAADLQLQAEDIVFVPESVGKNATRRGLEAILQTATGIAIYRR